MDIELYNITILDTGQSLTVNNALLVQTTPLTYLPESVFYPQINFETNHVC